MNGWERSADQRRVSRGRPNEEESPRTSGGLVQNEDKMTETKAETAKTMQVGSMTVQTDILETSLL